MRVVIDRAACHGHGRCYVLAPEVFDEDDLGEGQVRTEHVPQQLRESALNAVRNCPERAIHVSEENGDA
jgi:ferredoxin